MIADQLELLMRTAFGAWEPGHGCGADELRAVEAELGTRLPAPLRDFYATAGRHPTILDADFHVVPAGELRFEGDYLAFCAENQWVMSWGVARAALAEANPRVDVKWSSGDDWSAAAERLSAFLVGLTCWQPVMDAMATTGESDLAPEELAGLERVLRRVGDGQDAADPGSDWIAFADEARRTLALYVRGDRTLYASAPDEDALEDFEQRSGIELSWL